MIAELRYCNVTQTLLASQIRDVAQPVSGNDDQCVCSCHKLVAFSGELESSTQVLTLQQYLPACAPSLQHMLLAAYVGMSGLESAIAALGPVVFACTQLQSLNVCLQDCPFSSSTSEYKQVLFSPAIL